MRRYDPNRAGLDILLDLHREVAEIGGGWWVSFRAYEVEPCNGRPHGIGYSLTLHDPKGQRVLGYDNAHALDEHDSANKTGEGSAFDHVHRRQKRIPYTFKSPAELLRDFWRDVELILKEEGVT